MKRIFCEICNNNLNNIYKLYNVPINITCVEKNINYIYDELSFSQCIKCNTIQLDKLIPLNILYSSNHNNISVGKTWEDYFIFFVKYINNFIENKIILEIGCPSAKIATKCAGFEKWYIVEPNPVNKKFNENIIFIKSFFNENFYFKKIDIIIHSHVFEHIYNLNGFLKKCNDLLSDGGEMIFGVPNMEYLSENSLALFVGISFEHTVFLNKENICYILKKNNFKIVNILNYTNHSVIFHVKKEKNTELIDFIEIKNYNTLFFKLLDEYKLFIYKCNLHIENKNDNKIYIFGASYITQLLLLLGLKIDSIDGIIDNAKEKQNKFFYGLNLIIYDLNILNNNDIIIVKNGYYSEEIICQINNLNLNITIIN